MVYVLEHHASHKMTGQDIWVLPDQTHKRGSQETDSILLTLLQTAGSLVRVLSNS